MNIPFTLEQFFDIIRQYNETMWPAQWALNVLALTAIGLLVSRRESSDRMISGILSLLWAWTGIAYHLLFFSRINKAAFGFGALFLAGSGVFLWTGVIKRRLEFSVVDVPRRVAGILLIAYGLVVYPALSVLFGHAYPLMPTFGLPCPTTIFTIGLLFFLRSPFPRSVAVAPVLWSAVGSQAAFLFGVYQDLGLLVAGVAGIILIALPQTMRTAPA
jgi:Family of unknown function (DUF6064)